MIDKIIKEFITSLNALKLKQSREWFDMENVPDSLIDNCYVIVPIPFNPGESVGTESRNRFSQRIKQTTVPITIFYSQKTPANNLSEFVGSNAVKVEQIISSLTSIAVGADEKDNISFVGSAPSVVGKVLINKIDFNINYRIQ